MPHYSRFLTLKSNPQLIKNMCLRENIYKSIRNFFYHRSFHEVETPLLVPSVIPESYLEVFKTGLLDRYKKSQTMFLTTSPEASIKKLLAAGIGNCFEITKSFRNGETNSLSHNPEFTILEWYRISSQYFDIMRDCEQLLGEITTSLADSDAKNIDPSNLTLSYRGKEISLKPPYQRMAVIDLLDKFAGISFEEIVCHGQDADLVFKPDKIKGIVQKKGYKVTSADSWETIFNQVFLNEIEPRLAEFNKPVFVYDYPRPLAALSKIKKDDFRLAERFELYIGRVELADCYTELTDYTEQKERFKQEMELNSQKGRIMIKPDEDFLLAIKTGLPPCAGIAMGLDRLVMLFADTDNISDVLPFPNSTFNV